MKFNAPKGEIYVGQALTLNGKFEVVSERPLSLSRNRFQFVNIRGQPGCGKGSRAILTFESQFVAPYGYGPEDWDCNINIDLGGGNNEANNVERFTRDAGRTFRLFTHDTDYRSQSFPIFQGYRSGPQWIELAARGTHSEGGTQHGPMYYAAVGQGALGEAIREVVDEIRTLNVQALKKALQRQRNRFRDAEMVRLIVNVLSDYESIIEGGDSAYTIDIERAIDRGETLYFYLPTLEMPFAARLFAGLALFTTISVIIRRQKKRKPHRYVNIWIDEWHEIVGRSADALIAQARKQRCRIITANQSTAQLDNHRDLKLADSVFSNSTLKVYHTVTGQRDIDDLQWLSFEGLKKKGGGSRRGFDQTVSFREEMEPILDRNTILHVSNTPGLCFVIAGGQPLIVRQDHFFEDLSDRLLPLRTEEEKANDESIPHDGIDKASPRSSPPPCDGAWQQKLATVHRDLTALERWAIDPGDDQPCRNT